MLTRQVGDQPMSDFPRGLSPSVSDVSFFDFLYVVNKMYEIFE